MTERDYEPRNLAVALKGRNLNSLAFQRQAGAPCSQFRPEGAVLSLGIVGFRPFRAVEGGGRLASWR